MARPKHPHKDIEAVLRAAEVAGWRVEKAGPRAHPWGFLYCTEASRQGCRYAVASTPRNPTGAARRLARSVASCPHI